MKFALFVASAALVEAQCSQYSRQPSNCTAASNCTLTNTSASCYRISNYYCSHDNKTCGNNCAPGSTIQNPKTCSRCAPPECEGRSQIDCAGNPDCRWRNGGTSCDDIVLPYHCSGAKSESACIAQENCFWTNIVANVCGQAMPMPRCSPCNSSQFSDELRGGVENFVGQLCTHARGGDFDSAFSYAIYGYSQNAQCNATSASNASDLESLSEFMDSYGFSIGRYFDTDSSPPHVCGCATDRCAHCGQHHRQ